MISVICIMVLNGWEMGVSESIGVVLLIGLSVDYVVHLASHFSSASDEKLI
jgi:predicted RND superfamily exporter protein